MNDDQIKAVFGQLGEILDRVVRLESRMVHIMHHLGLDPYSRKSSVPNPKPPKHLAGEP